MRSYLFLYGTLLPEHAPSVMRKVVRKLRPVGRGTVRGHLYDFEKYPGATLDPSSPTAITGQVFALPHDQQILPLLDQYEGFDSANLKQSLFVRKRCHVAMLDGRVLLCWIYEYNRAIGSARLIQGGDYLPSPQHPPQRRRDTDS